MRFLVATVALLCAVMAPQTVDAQGSSSNNNDCSISPLGTNSSGDVTVGGTGAQAGQTVTLTGVSVTFPTTLANDPVIAAYNAGTFGLSPGLNDIYADVTVRVAASNTVEGARDLHVLALVTVDIQDPFPGSIPAHLAPLDATVFLPNSAWTPTDLNVEFTQIEFVVASGGTSVDCVPSVSPTPFEAVLVTPPPCDDTIDCNLPNGACDFWGNCICEAGFGGADCACADAIDCTGNGACDAGGNCACYPGFGGSDCACEDAIDCNGNGACNFAGDCYCFPGFGGPDCTCNSAIDCNGNGACDASGVCVCNPEYTGSDCTTLTCVPEVDCNSNGQCVAGECVCDPEYTGSDCTTLTCVPEVDCNSNGQCVAGECVCDAGYFGEDCGTPICDLEANCNGIPVGIGALFVHVSETDPAGSTIDWQNAEFSMFGEWDVNLGLAGANPLTVPPQPLGGVVLNAATIPASGTFVANYLSQTGILDFNLTGDYVCPANISGEICGPQPGEWWNTPYEATFVTNLATLSGSFVDAGVGTLPTSLNGVPVTYALDGALDCHTIIGAVECTGTALLSAFKGVNTTTGTEVSIPVSQVFVDPADPTGQTLIPVNLEITFDAVTGDGHTTVVTSSQAAGSISSNFVIDSLGGTPVFLDITTTAELADEVTVCAEYPGSFANECDLRLLHNDDAGLDEFLDATLGEAHEDCPFPDAETTCANNLCINTVTNQICGGATSLSPWVIAEYVGNQAPVADAGADQAIVLVGTAVQLDGSASYDLDGDSFSYAWTLQPPAGSNATLVNPASVAPTFVPDLYGPYEASLVVTDSNGLPSAPDGVTVSFDNLPPVADAGPNQAVRVGVEVLLDGSGSDPNGDPLSYQWSLVSQPAGSIAALDDPLAQMPTFTPDLSGTYEAQLSTSDGLLNSQIAVVSIVATTAEGDLIETLEEAIDVVNGLDASVFKNKSLQKNMAKHIGQAAAKVDQAKFNAARDKLEAVLRKTDGCANVGSPDPNDWIEDCAAQSQTYPLIVQAIALVDEILGN
ncbi:MAG: PKD domain-containing protein [Polyangiales bacterium]